MACQSPKPGYLLLGGNVTVTLQDVTDETACNISDVTKAFEIFTKQKMIEEIDGIFHVVNWDKRQFSSDSSTERVRKHRDLKRQGNVSVTPPDTDTDTDTDIYSSSGITKFYLNNINQMAPALEVNQICSWLDTLPGEAIHLAMQKAMDAKVRTKATTMGAINEYERKFKENQSGYRKNGKGNKPRGMAQLEEMMGSDNLDQ
jgi:hypothetical protein